jgi:hypothetical protein
MIKRRQTTPVSRTGIVYALCFCLQFSADFAIERVGAAAA